ncbi:unnamed protein product [Fraxinus pennsylvanica]|uniref:Uncharacterized protein n=1 Tax=Fraxinus pennsylvanica TaxID=56036 RepID=A0AAD1Z4M7_9LAMI|nr:unnamed protein product [Fraxinus pennsylvanica]
MNGAGQAWYGPSLTKIKVWPANPGQQNEPNVKFIPSLYIILRSFIAIALSPITPSLCLRIYTQLGYSEDQFKAVTWNDTKWGGLKCGQIMAQPNPVFGRIELETEAKNAGESAKKASKKMNKTPKTQKAVEA